MKRYDYERATRDGYRIFDRQRGLAISQTMALCIRRDQAELITDALNAMDTRDENIRLHDRAVPSEGEKTAPGG